MLIVELRDYLRILRRGWVWIAACAVGAVAIAAVASVVLSASSVYTSTARVLVSTPLADSRFAEGNDLFQFTQQRVRSYVALVSSDVLASRVAEDQERDNGSNVSAYEVSADLVPNTDLLDITVSGPSPEGARRLATAYADEFVALVSEFEQPPSGGEPLVSASVVSTAGPASSSGALQPIRYMSLAAMLGLLFGVGVVLLRDALDTRVFRAEGLAELAETPTLGVIPFDAEARQRPLVVPVEPRSPSAEAYRRLRTNLQLRDTDATRRVTVTSSITGEGKTTTAVNLGVVLADAGVRSLLLDGDLRRPKVAEYLGLSPGVGLTDLLAGTADIDDAIQIYGESRMQVIPSGPLPPNPSELLDSPAMVDLLIKLESRADVVLIDSPSALPVTDAAILAALSDGAILVTRYGHTKAEQVREAVMNLEQAGGRVLGAVLTMARGPDGYRNTDGYSDELPGKRTSSPSKSADRTASGVNRTTA